MTSRILKCFTAFALVGLLVAAPASNEEDDLKVEVTRDYYIEPFVKYTSKHDIVKLMVPLNSLNFDESESSSSESDETDIKMILFFVEADVQADGSRVDQGLYVLKDGKAKKILENGRDAAASGDDSRKAFFGAKDGLYVYNEKTNSADKYGPITDSIIGVEKENFGDVIYILTEDREVYKVTDNGEKKEKLDDVVKAKQIVLDYESNLYFYSDDNVPYVRTADGVKKIEGLPESTGSVRLFKAPFVIENGVPILINNQVYVLYANGTSENTDFGFKPAALPSAIAAEAALMQYYAFEKKIYEYNVLDLVMSCIIEDLGTYLKKQETQIKAVSSNVSSKKRKFKPSNKA